MAKKQFILVMKPGKPNIDRRALCKMFGIQSGIYTQASGDAPIWLQDALRSISDVVFIVEPELGDKDYTVLAFPASCGRSTAMSAARLRYVTRIHTHYWFDPADIQEIDNLVDCYGQLDNATEDYNRATEVFADTFSRINYYPTQEAAYRAGLSTLSPAINILDGAVETLLHTISKRLSGLLKRGIARPQLFTP